MEALNYLKDKGRFLIAFVVRRLTCKHDAIKIKYYVNVENDIVRKEFICEWCGKVKVY